MTRRHLVTAVAAMLVSLAIAATACGIPTDEQPRAIAPSTTASGQLDTTSTLAPGSPNGVEELVYLIEGSATASSDGERLAPRSVLVPNTSDEADLVKSTIVELIALQSDKGLTNAVPSGTRVLDATLNGDGTELTLDLSEEFDNVQQSLQRRAFAQIVFTATGVTPANVNRVKFLVDGDPIAPATDNEATPAVGDAVSRSDYPSFAASIASSTTELGES